ncbi:hypothetical protein [Arthrobacter sp. LFS091]|uniref:hypothetical protein n=1 Tax=Arthrobacter sp. LFS091 TaxID=3229892 RepID=UPI003A7FB7CF
MKFAFFDGIVETHVASSLERALVAAGHKVYNTGKIGHGFKFATGSIAIGKLKRELDKVLEFEPDVIFVFRPASLPPELLRRAKSTGARLVVWLSDDPVLWDLTYGPVIEQYDIVLHCGTERVLQFYQDSFGRPTGVNFPFWTDSKAFPYVFGTEERETDAMFLGNVHDEVRRKRYFDLGGLNSSVRIHGAVGRDYFNVWGGFLDSDREVLQAGARAGVAINIPQYFRDHRGLETWFTGLDELGFFQYPSRVIQYAAMGLPIISVVPTPSDLSSFPEVMTVPSMEELDRTIHEIVNSESLQQLSVETHLRFRKNYSAEARVLALESVLEDDSWKKLNAWERSMWFTQFDADAQQARFTETPASEVVWRRPSVEVNRETMASTSFVVVGSDLRRVTSTTSVLTRGLTELGHDVKTYDAAFSNFLVPDPNGEFRFVINAHKLLSELNEIPAAVFLSGIDCGLTESGLEKLHSAGIKVCAIGVHHKSLDARMRRLLQRMDLVCLLNAEFTQNLIETGHENVVFLPPLVDRGFFKALGQLGERRSAAVSVAKRKLHYETQAAALRDLDGGTLEHMYVEEMPDALLSLDALAEKLNVSVLLAPHDSSLPGPLPSELLPFALASGALVAVPRALGPMNVTEAGTAMISVREKGELLRKLARLAVSTSTLEAYLAEARKLVADKLNAERQISKVISRLERIQLTQELVVNETASVVSEGVEVQIESTPRSSATTLLSLTFSNLFPEGLNSPFTLIVRSSDDDFTYLETVDASRTVSKLQIQYPKAPTVARLAVSLKLHERDLNDVLKKFVSSTLKEAIWSASPDPVDHLTIRSSSQSGRLELYANS